MIELTGSLAPSILKYLEAKAKSAVTELHTLEQEAVAHIVSTFHIVEDDAKALLSKLEHKVPASGSAN